ncbi:MAG: ribosome biogenesis GTPase Der [Clostridium sp.]
MRPIVAIIGRPNVGKSKLFNYLIGERLSIVEDTPGVTRDRIVAKTSWNGVEFDLIDTAGVEEANGDIIKEQMMIQTDAAIELADVVLFLTDVKSGVHAEDIEIFKKLKKAKKNTVLAVNKCDKLGEVPLEFYEFYKLSEEPLQISAANATGLGDMLDKIVSYLPKENNTDDSNVIKVAMIGKPNVGKSSLINKMVGENRNIVSNIAGTTRDAVDTFTKNNFGEYIFIDTAGIRKSKKVEEKIEKYSIIRSMLAIERADICVLVIDAEAGPTEQDTKILGEAHNLGKGIIIVVNKWDMIDKDNHTYNEYKKKVEFRFKYASYAPIIFTSAVTGQRISDIFKMINTVYANTRKELKTADINKIIEESIAFSQPPSDKGRKLKIYYGAQSGICPPTFTLFINDKELFHFSYQRYIMNNIRKSADFTGVRLKLNIRERNE